MKLKIKDTVLNKWEKKMPKEGTIINEMTDSKRKNVKN